MHLLLSTIGKLVIITKLSSEFGVRRWLDSVPATQCAAEGRGAEFGVGETLYKPLAKIFFSYNGRLGKN